MKMDFEWFTGAQELLNEEGDSWDAQQLRLAAREFLRRRRQALAMASFLEDDRSSGRGSMGRGRHAPKIRKRPPLLRGLVKFAAVWTAKTWRDLARSLRLDADLMLERAAALDKRPETAQEPSEYRYPRGFDSDTKGAHIQRPLRYQPPGPSARN